MKLIILPGNSPNNKEWAEDIRKEFVDFFDSVYVQDYSHWGRSDEIDFDGELKKLVKEADRNDIVFFAKSVGMALVLKGIYDKKISPHKCIFFGLPLSWCRKRGIPIERWLENYNKPSMFIQQTEDPFLPFSKLDWLLKSLNVRNYTLYEIEGDDHSYSNIESFASMIKERLILRNKK